MRTVPAVIFFSFVPTGVLAALGILAIVFQRGGLDITFGVLILIFSIAVLSGGIYFMIYAQGNLRRQQLQVDFVSKVSHELRTPLSAIRMFVDTLEQEELATDERIQCMAAISSETSRLSSMIERLLTWGRMESGRQVYQPRPERADTLVAEALVLAQAQLMSAGVDVELDIPEEVPAVLADRAAVVDTLLNLVRNSLAYGSSGGVLILQVRSLPKGRVAIDVADQGPGIPRKEQRRIFEKFYRGSTAERLGAGSGLGLAMARHVVRAHKGRIVLRSVPGQGACFTVVLPAALAEEALEVPAT